MTAFRAFMAQTPEAGGGSLTGGDANALKPFGCLDRRSGRIVDARPEMLRRGKQADREELGRGGDTVPDIAGAHESCGIDARNPCRAGARECVEDTGAAG